MRYLLDTNVALFAMSASASLPAAVLRAVEQGPLVISTISYWEVVLKSMKGKLDVGDPRTWWREALGQLAAATLPLMPEHIAAIQDLPPIHQDPFDRALIAQAAAEELTLLTTDGNMQRYASRRVRVIS